MDKFLKSYQKLLGLDYPIMDKYIRIIFVANIPYIWYLLILTDDLQMIREAFEPIMFCIFIAISLLIPRLIVWLITPFFKID